MQKTLPRLLEATLSDRLKRSPVVVLTGARQTGKTTLVQALPEAANRRFVTLDRLTALDLARREPEPLVASAPRMTIDEVQRAPELLLAVKRSVDEDRRPGRFLLTGSANLLLLRSTAESLAGRVLFLVLRPLTPREKRRDISPPLWSALLAAGSALAALDALGEHHPFDWRLEALEGGLPPAALAVDPQDRQLWLEGYVDTYLQRDLRDLTQVGDLAAFSRLMRLAALRGGGLINYTDLARDAATSRATAQRWLSVLEASFVISLVQPFTEARAKRLIKAPKLYALDTGLALHLAGVTDRDGIDEMVNAGAVLENLVLNDLLVWRETEIRKPGVFYRRTASGEEIDFIIESGRRLLPIEVKAARTLRSADAKALDHFCAEFGRRAPFGIVIYDGRDRERLSARVAALPLGSVL